MNRKSLFSKFILVVLIVSNIQMQAAFSFAKLYGSAIEKVSLLKSLFVKNKNLNAKGVAKRVFKFGASNYLKNKINKPVVKVAGIAIGCALLVGLAYLVHRFLKKPDTPSNGGANKARENKPNIGVNNINVNFEEPVKNVVALNNNIPVQSEEERKRLEQIAKDEEYARKLQGNRHANVREEEKKEEKKLVPQEGQAKIKSIVLSNPEVKNPEVNPGVNPEVLDVVSVPKPEQQKPVQNQVVEDNETKSCGICLEDFKDKELKDIHKMSCCGVKYCIECLNANIDHAIGSDDLNLLRCPNPDCKKEISENDARAITTGNMDRLNKFNELKDKKLIEGMPGAKRCPGCDTIYINEPDANGMESRQRITCAKCKRSYCASCREDHSPEISCEQARKEAKQKEGAKLSSEDQERLRKEEAETAKFVKPCPRCHLNIEKDNGCKHMHCTKCGLHFCWDCLGHLPIDGNQHKDGGYPHNDYYDCPAHPESRINLAQEFMREMWERLQRENGLNNVQEREM